MDAFLNPDLLVGFITLVALEIVLGIDNIIFISILTNKLPEDQRERGRKLGLFLALFARIALLFSLSLIMKLTTPLFTVHTYSLSGRDLILLLGGLFLIFKSVKEIHHKVEEASSQEEDAHIPAKISFNSIIMQIILIDIVFSLDSVITAVGMVSNLYIMIAAVVVSVLVMLLLSGSIANFVNKHPAVKVLALAFLIMIGTALVAEGLHFHFPKAYIYFAMAFSVGVEAINIRAGLRGAAAKMK
ncbi:MAG: TerC family protein [Saprospiraceae bacterium]|nr:TerC family protein [Saprospiraceae bacterium]